ncbi:hypothetical protein [Rhodopseudomonas sp. BR0G17]|uniref:hypothetical protein n=1 Tax=Rhodopseudomonas sp. BR0G17 TaxID=2269368 RepID=UPI0032DF639D
MITLHKVAHRGDRQKSPNSRLEIRCPRGRIVVDRRNLGDVVGAPVRRQLDAPPLGHLVGMIRRVGIWHLVGDKPQRAVEHVERERIAVEIVDRHRAVRLRLIEHPADFARVSTRHRIFPPGDLAPLDGRLRFLAGEDHTFEHHRRRALRDPRSRIGLGLDRGDLIARLAGRIDRTPLVRRRLDHVGLEHDALGGFVRELNRHLGAAFALPMLPDPGVPTHVAHMQQIAAEMVQQPPAVAEIVLRLARAGDQHRPRYVVGVVGPRVVGRLDFPLILALPVGVPRLGGVRGFVEVRRIKAAIGFEHSRNTLVRRQITASPRIRSTSSIMFW